MYPFIMNDLSSEILFPPFNVFFSFALNNDINFNVLYCNAVLIHLFFLTFTVRDLRFLGFKLFETDCPPIIT